MHAAGSSSSTSTNTPPADQEEENSLRIRQENLSHESENLDSSAENSGSGESSEELQLPSGARLVANPETLKTQANEEYKNGAFSQALSLYTQAIASTTPDQISLRSVLYSNRAAANQQLGDLNTALQDATEAVKLDPKFVKGHMRRYRINAKLEKWHDAVKDLKTALELSPELRSENEQNLARAERESKEQLEREKAEMMGKLKEFGNFMLGKVGLSTDNFKMEQNESGSYNIQFQPNKS